MKWEDVWKTPVVLVLLVGAILLLIYVSAGYLRDCFFPAEPPPLNDHYPIVETIPGTMG